jgi:hypothetical protein
MLHLKYRLDQETLGISVVPAKCQHFADDAATGLSFQVNNQVDRFSDLGFCVGERRLGVASNDEIGEPMESLLSGIRMNCRKRSGMTCIEGIEQRQGFDSPALRPE